MPERRAGQGRGKRGNAQKAGPEAAREEVERLLDAIEQAIIEGDQAQVPALIGQLWDVRRAAPVVLEERVRTGRARIPAFAFEMLGGFAGARAPAALKRIAADPAVPDIVRWGARRRAGWSERGETKARLAFLASLSNGDETLVDAMTSAGQGAPPDLNVLEEVVNYLRILAPERRLRVLRTAIDGDVPRLEWVLRALLHVPDPPFQQACIASLLARLDRGAVAALTRLARTAGDPAVRGEADAAARRLALHVVEGGGPGRDQDQEEEPLGWPELEGVQISQIDGEGGQGVIMTRRWPAGMEMLFTFFWKDRWGVRDAWGIFQRAPDVDGQDAMSTMVMEFGDQIAFVEGDLAIARGVLAVAVETAAANGNPLPPALELWAPFLHEAYPPDPADPVASVEPDPALLPANWRTLVKQSASLLDHPAFASWYFSPEDMQTFLLATAGSLTPVPLAPQDRDILDHRIDETFGAVLQQRLRRQAWLLDRSGDRAAARLALAVAASMEGTTPDALREHPFVQAMAQRSLAAMYGPLLTTLEGFQ